MPRSRWRSRRATRPGAAERHTGNLTELVIALAALRAGQYVLVKASIAGAIVTNMLFMLGASFLLGGLKHHVQEYNRASARLQSGLLFLATVALLIPSAVGATDAPEGAAFIRTLSVGLAVLLTDLRHDLVPAAASGSVDASPPLYWGDPRIFGGLSRPFLT
jgi:calcium/proton exchanger cax